MPIDYSDHSAVLAALKTDQDAEHDRREKVREIHSFLDKPDGQWEPEILQSLNNRPRYTFDKCNPVVDDIRIALQFGVGKFYEAGQVEKRFQAG